MYRAVDMSYGFLVTGPALDYVYETEHCAQSSHFLNWELDVTVKSVSVSVEV